MSDKQRLLVERACLYQMTTQEIQAQVIDFAYANGHFEDERVTREGVARAAAQVSVTYDGREITLTL
jgi:hypothetical protein